MKIFSISTIIYLIILFSPRVFSQIPKIISYQGIVTDTAGNPKPDGQYNFTFRLYDSNSGGSPFWSESKKLIVKKGVFSTNLGDQSPFGNDVKFDKQYWLSIQIESDPELSPKIPLTSAGYSISSINSDTANYAKQFKINNGQLVRSVNGLKDNITLKGSGGAAVTSNGDTIIIAASGGGSGGGISAIQNTDNTLSISNPNGPTTTVNLHSPFIVNSDVGIGVNSPAAKLDVNGGSGTGAEIGIHGSSNDNYGIYGTSNNNYGLFGESAGWVGVYARTYATGTYALMAGNGAGNKNYCGLASGTYSLFANGPAALSTVGIGAAPDQNSFGIKLNINSGSATAINVTSSGYAIYAVGSSYFSGQMGIGVLSPAGKLDVNGDTYIGIHGSSNNDIGVYGSSNNWHGIFGESGTSEGVFARTYNANSYAFYAENKGTSGVICGLAAQGYGLYTNSPIIASDLNLAYNLSVSGMTYLTNLKVSGTKDFCIDHPLDPANKYLIHSCIESPDRMNIYNGNIVTDITGSAVVNLPVYFQALNIDYRYQLTVIGQFAQAIVENEISNNQFTIKTDKPNVKVSWQVTGIRNDAYAKANPMVVEEEKASKDRGKYLMPELYGKPKETGINFVKPPEITVKDTNQK
ncbi:MAG: hypothetical protein WCE54_01740 [Ignavibacteriaceae bacterium]